MLLLSLLLILTVTIIVRSDIPCDGIMGTDIATKISDEYYNFLGNAITSLNALDSAVYNVYSMKSKIPYLNVDPVTEPENSVIQELTFNLQLNLDLKNEHGIYFGKLIMMMIMMINYSYCYIYTLLLLFYYSLLKLYHIIS